MIMKKLEFFKGVKQDKDKASDDLKVFHTSIEILNFSPQRYGYTHEWVNFVNNAIKSFSSTISKAHPDEFVAGMMDPYIDSQYMAMMASIDDQRVEHESLLLHNHRILTGALYKLNAQVKLLDRDLADNAAAKADLLTKTTR